VKEKQSNLAPEFVEALSERLRLPFDPASYRGLHTKLDPVIASAAKQSYGDRHVAPGGAPRNDGNVMIGNVWFNKDRCFSGEAFSDDGELKMAGFGCHPGHSLLLYK